MANEIKIKLTIDGKQAEAVLDKTQLQSERVSSTFDQIKNTAVGNFIAQQFSNALSSLKQLIAESEQLAITQEQQDAKLRQLVKTTGQAAGFTYEQLKAQASGLQQLTTFGDENIQSLQSKLLTFKSVQGEIYEGVVKLALDTGELFGSAESAILQYGKAFEDPARNLSQLRRVGITFSEEQEEQIKKFQESNQLVKAQSMLMQILEGQLGGVAEAMAQTDSGKLQQFNNRLGDTQEKIGAVILKMKVQMLPVWESFLDVTDRLLGYQKTEVQQLQDQQDEIHLLINQITFLNPENERRIELLNQLNEQYPELLENIDLEKVSNDELLEVLKEVNIQKAEQILTAKTLQPVQDAYTKSLQAQQSAEKQKDRLITSITELEKKYGKTIADVGIERGKYEMSLKELHELTRVFGVSLKENISLEEAKNRINKSTVAGYSQYSIQAADVARSQHILNEEIEKAEEFLLATGLSQERVNELLSKYRIEAAESAKETEEKTNQEEKTVEVVKTYSEELKKLNEELETLKDLQAPDAEDEARIAQLEREVEALEKKRDLQRELRDESFKPSEEDPEHSVIEDNNAPEDIDLSSDPMVEMYSQRELAAMNLYELQAHLMDLEAAKRESTSQEYINAINDQINAVQTAIQVEQNRIQAMSAIGQGIANQIKYAKSVKEATKGVLKSIAAEITGLFIRNALQTAGASGPAALIAAPILVAAAQRLSSAAIDQIPAFAEGGHFMTDGPQMILVGDNPSGKEEVRITPIEEENSQGPKDVGVPQITVNVRSNINFTPNARALKDTFDELNEIEEVIGN